jgi:integrase
MARNRFQRGTLLPKRGFPKNGRWVGRWREDIIDTNGNLKRNYRWEVIGTVTEYPTRKLALRALEQRLTEANSVTYRARPQATFAAFAEKWKETVLTQHKRSSQASTKSLISYRLVPALGKLTLKEIDPQIVQSLVSRCNCSCSPKTVKNAIAVLRTIWKSAQSWGYVERSHDPFDGLVLPKRGIVRRKVLMLEQIGKVIAAAEEPHRTFYMILAETGIRGGEICALRWSDVDLENGVVFVRQSSWQGRIQTVKSKKGNRRFPASPQLVEHLREFRRGWTANPLDLIFATSKGTPWRTGWIRERHFHPLLQRLGIELCGFHAFRHGNATLLDHLAAPMAVRQDRLGHEEAATTMGYTHPITSDERRIAVELGKILHASCTLLDVNGRTEYRTQVAENR